MTTPIRATSTRKGKTKHTKIGKPKPAFVAIIKEAELAMNFSYGSCDATDEQGNKVRVYIWVSGDWKVHYKDKEYIIPMSENVNALIEWINKNEQKD